MFAKGIYGAAAEIARSGALIMPIAALPITPGYKVALPLAPMQRTVLITQRSRRIATMPPQLSGVLFSLAAFAVFATHDAVVKDLGARYSPVQIVFFSVLFGFPILTFMLMRDAQGGSLVPRHPGWTALRMCSVVITGMSAFFAFTLLPLAQVYAILFAAPLLITILAIPILGERVGWRRWLAVVVGLGGVVVVLQPASAPLSTGHIMAMVAAIGGAVSSVVMRKIGRDERAVVMMLYPMMANFVVMGAILAVVYQPMPAVDLGKNAIVSVFALLGVFLLILAYRRAPAAIVAPMQYSQILWASIFGALLFEETLDRATIVGSAIIIASGVFIVLREASGKTSNTTPVLRSRSRPGSPAAPRVSAFLPDNRRGPH